MNKLYILVFILGLSLNSFAWGFSARDAVRQSSENPSYYLGDYVSFAWDLNSTGWGATYKKAGIGTTNTSAGTNWLDIVWVDDAGDGFGNNEGVTNSSAKVTSTGTWYYSLWLGWGASVGDNGRWYNGNSTWTEGSGTFISSSFTVNALNNPSSQTATTASSSSINLSWNKDAQNHYVMILRKKSTDSWTEPTQGTVYSVGATVGSATVIYFSNGISYTSASLTSSTGYDYKFYSENNGYYSAGVTASATTQTASTDYFRSKTAGVWNSSSIWETSNDNTAWVNATLAPNSSANSVVVNHAVNIDGTETVGNLTINSGKSLTINSSKSLTVSGTLTNNAGTSGLVVESGGSLKQSTADVDATVKRSITAVSNWATDKTGGWHFISSPIVSQAINTDGGFVTSGGSNDYDFYAWSEPDNLWVNFKNTSVAPTFTSVNGSGNFVVGRGYMAAYEQSGTKQFTGKLNISDVAISGMNITSGTAVRSWHLLGNPFSCALIWDGTWTNTNVGGTCQVWDESLKDYYAITSGPIPAMNGFMIEVSADGASITIPASKREHNAQVWYKNSEKMIKLIARSADKTSGKECMIRFDEMSTSGFDMDYDGHYLRGYGPLFYSLAGNEQLSVNTLPAMENGTEIQLAFAKNDASEFSIETSELESLNATVYLTDFKTGTVQNLNLNPVYSFSAAEGDQTNRFKLSFGSVGISTPETSNTGIYTYGNKLCIKNPGNATLEVYNMAGQQMLSQQISSTGLYQTRLTGSTGYYVVRLVNAGNVRVSKVFVQ